MVFCGSPLIRVSFVAMDQWASPKHFMEVFSRHKASLIGRKNQAKFENDCISRSRHRFKLYSTKFSDLGIILFCGRCFLPLPLPHFWKSAIQQSSFQSILSTLIGLCVNLLLVVFLCFECLSPTLDYYWFLFFFLLARYWKSAIPLLWGTPDFFSPNRFAFYSVKATCINTTGIKLSIFQLRLQVQVQFIMAKNTVGYARPRSPNLSIQRPVLYQYATNKALRSVVLTE